MKRLTLFALFIAVLVISCKKDEPSTPAVAEIIGKSTDTNEYNLNITHMLSKNYSSLDTVYYSHSQMKISVNTSLSAGNVTLKMGHVGGDELFNETYSSNSSQEQIVFVATTNYYLDVSVVNASGDFTIAVTAQ